MKKTSSNSPLFYGRPSSFSHVVALVAILSLSVTLGCASGGTSPTTGTAAAAPPPVDSPGSMEAASQPTRFVLSSGDELNVKFYYVQDLNEEVIIRPDGMISLQLVGDVEAAGKTPAELRADLIRLYTGILAQPEVAVIVKTFSLPQVFVGGEVENPGVFDLTKGLTLLQSIVVAGGFSDFGTSKNVILVRKGSDGKPITLVQDLREMVSGKGSTGDIALQPFDVVLVPMAGIVKANRWVERYITDMLPVRVGIGFSYILNPNEDGNLL